MKYDGTKTRRTWLRFFRVDPSPAFIIETRGPEPWLRFCDSTHPAFFIRTGGAEPLLGSRIPDPASPSLASFSIRPIPSSFIQTRGAEPPLGSRIPRSGLPRTLASFFRIAPFPPSASAYNEETSDEAKPNPGAALKAKKPLKRLNRIEKMLSGILDGYTAAEPNVREFLDSAKASVSSAKAAIKPAKSKTPKAK